MFTEITSKTRSQERITADFLRTIKDHALIKNDIMRACNLNNAYFEDYKTRLLEGGYIEVVGENRYQATRGGRKLLEQIMDVQEKINGKKGVET